MTTSESVGRILAGVLVCQLAVSVVLTLAMATRSQIDAHPDERLHVSAAEYFRTHWLSPPVGAPETAASYSRYGISYLNEGDVAYWVLGKAAAIGQHLGAGPAVAMRYLQVLLFVSLVIWVVARAGTFPPALGFLLLTPQVWYVFSYVNSDALPFFLCMGLLLELGWPESGLRRFVRGDTARPSVGVFAAGALFGLLILSKLNYLVAALFVPFAAQWLRADMARRARVVVPLAVAAAIALPWSYHRAWVNDFQTGARAVEYAEKVAAPDMKPSAYANPTSFPFLAMRAKGVPLSALFTRFDWLGLSFRSASGLYGWMRVVAVPWVYLGFGLLDLALLAILALPVAVRGPRRARILLLGVLLFSAVVFAQSVYRSWVFDFQAQGRYLFPIVPMLCFYWRQCETPTLRVPALVVTMLLGGLSLFSFALVGLASLA